MNTCIPNKYTHRSEYVGIRLYSGGPWNIKLYSQIPRYLPGKYHDNYSETTENPKSSILEGTQPHMLPNSATPSHLASRLGLSTDRDASGGGKRVRPDRKSLDHSCVCAFLQCNRPRGGARGSERGERNGRVGPDRIPHVLQ
jgi:hypothetical protein